MQTCIVVPCYNEAKRLDVQAFLHFLQSENTVGFCFVNDGSTDQTLSLLQNIQQQYLHKVLIKNLLVNSGKAEAVRQGILEVCRQNISRTGFIDADLSTPLHELEKLLAYLDRYQFVFGSRVHLLNSQIKRSNIRHYLGRIFATFASAMLGLPIYDTQCGAKLFNTELAQILMQSKFITRWLFDVEIFARLINIEGHQKLYNIAIEVPLSVWIDKGDTKLKLSDFFATPLQLLKIKRHYFGSKSLNYRT